jgi:(p)ppGpp synthase/HD superfamily hydrolase
MTGESTVEFHQKLERALSFATRLHAEQTRKGTDIPYISHLIGVAGLVMEHGGDVDETVAALLHDAIEDQGPEYEGGSDNLRAEIENRFGPSVLEIVEGCTDADTEPKPPWRERKEGYIAHIKAAPSSVRLVSSADKLHNARAIVADLRVVGDGLWSRFNGGKEGTLWYYRALVTAFEQAGGSPLVEELDRVVSEMERLARR